MEEDSKISKSKSLKEKENDLKVSKKEADENKGTNDIKNAKINKIKDEDTYSDEFINEDVENENSQKNKKTENEKSKELGKKLVDEKKNVHDSSSGSDKSKKSFKLDTQKEEVLKAKQAPEKGNNNSIKANDIKTLDEKKEAKTSKPDSKVENDKTPSKEEKKTTELKPVKNDSDPLIKTEKSSVNEYSKDDDFINESNHEGNGKDLNELPSKNAQKKNENKTEENSRDKKLQEQFEKLTEEDVIKITNKCSECIAESLIQAHQTIYKLYKDCIKTIEFEAEEIDVITQDDFLEGLGKINVQGVSEFELNCLMNLLGLNFTKRYIKALDLVNLVKQFNIQDKDADLIMKRQNEEAIVMDFNQLDQVSFALLIAILEFANSERLSIYQLIEHMIEKKKNEKGKETFVISTKNFFDILNQIGIEAKETDSENLIRFLSLDAKNKNYLEVRKIKNSIEELMNDEHLFQTAKQCYEELVDIDPRSEALNNNKQIMENPENEEY